MILMRTGEQVFGRDFVIVLANANGRPTSVMSIVLTRYRV